MNGPSPSAPGPGPGRLDRLKRFLLDVARTRLDKSGFRLRLIGIAFLCVFGLIDAKLIKLGLEKRRLGRRLGRPA